MTYKQRQMKAARFCFSDVQVPHCWHAWQPLPNFGMFNHELPEAKPFDWASRFGGRVWEVLWELIDG